MRLTLIPLLCFTLAAEVPSNADLIAKEDWTPTTEAKVQFQRDPKFIYATLFPNQKRSAALLKELTASGRPKLADSQSLTESLKRSKLLSRIVVTMALGGLKYTTTANDKEHLKDWDMPLASAICHGQRVVFEFPGVKVATKVYSLWVEGRETELKSDPYPRSFASHGLEWGSDGKTLTEVKVKPTSGVTLLTNWAKGNHHGVDLAFGGFGTPRLDGGYVGPGGCKVDETTYAVDTKAQHGHLYIHTDQGTDISGLLVGIEPTAFGSKSMFGTEHTAASSYEDSTKDTGVAGGQKMQLLLGENGPSKYGGMWVIFKSAKDYEILKLAIAAVDNMDATARKELFWTILAQTAPLARSTLRQALRVNTSNPPELREAMKD